MSVRPILTVLGVVFAATIAAVTQASAARLALDRTCYVNRDEPYLARVHRDEPIVGCHCSRATCRSW